MILQALWDNPNKKVLPLRIDQAPVPAFLKSLHPISIARETDEFGEIAGQVVQGLADESRRYQTRAPQPRRRRALAPQARQNPTGNKRASRWGLACRRGRRSGHPPGPRQKDLRGARNPFSSTAHSMPITRRVWTPSFLQPCAAGSIPAAPLKRGGRRTCVSIAFGGLCSLRSTPSMTSRDVEARVRRISHASICRWNLVWR